MRSIEGAAALERVRGICLQWPEAEEIVDGFGHNTFKVNGKSFVIMGEDERDGTIWISFKSDRETQSVLILQDGYVKTPYIGQHGWVSTNPPERWDELTELIREAYLRAAPKRLVKELGR